MIKNLIQYPDPTIRLISANVRFFNDELSQWIIDMIDTIKANNLDALSAIMIGIQYSIIVIKEGDNYTPYINCRLIKQSGMRTQTERSTYYSGISVDVDRFETVTVIYEDEKGNSHHRDLDPEMSRIFQQQIDYCFGSTFVDRVDKEMKQRINDHLEHGLVEGGGSCPVVFIRDYYRRGARYLNSLITLTFILPFFVSDTIREWVYTIDKYALIPVPLLIITYFLYAQHEARLYKQCTSCQTGNIIGTTAILTFQFCIVSLGVFFWVAQK
jgi:peptide deformylase